jgi:hypothetical protein
LTGGVGRLAKALLAKVFSFPPTERAGEDGNILGGRDDERDGRPRRSLAGRDFLTRSGGVGESSVETVDEGLERCAVGTLPSERSQKVARANSTRPGEGDRPDERVNLPRRSLGESGVAGVLGDKSAGAVRLLSQSLSLARVKQLPSVES